MFAMYAVQVIKPSFGKDKRLEVQRKGQSIKGEASIT
jgi:hypothetical protein